MLSKADDYPIHQRPEPIAFAGSDRNFYDRYFFNAQAPDGSGFVAGALGVYPHLNVMDAAVCWMAGGVQRSVFASRLLGMERMDTHVGPIAVAVQEPLQRLRLTLAETDGLALDLVFTGRHPPIEEPRFTWRQGPRTLMDATRMTQNVTVDGWASLDGARLSVSGWRGTRDRSWGVRPVGAPDAQGPAPPAPPQFFWLWAPMNFEQHCLYFHTNDHGDGTPWNRSAVLVDLTSGARTKIEAPEIRLTHRPGTRQALTAGIEGRLDGGRLQVTLAPEQPFHMHGIGYGHPRFGHGLWRGPLDVATERFDSGAADASIPLNAHVQAPVAAEMHLPDGSRHRGRGVLEQLAIGPHAPSGFRELYDLA
jgi:hypothetical protein